MLVDNFLLIVLISLFSSGLELTRYAQDLTLALCYGITSVYLAVMGVQLGLAICKASCLTPCTMVLAPFNNV